METLKNFIRAELSHRRLMVLAIYIFVIVFVSQDAFLYRDPIIKITSVVTKKTKTVRDGRGGEETLYRQSVKGRVLNGKFKGKTTRADNTYASSEAFQTKYRKGDKVFVDMNRSAHSCTLKGHKRDAHLAALVGLLFMALVLLTGRDGVKTLLTVIGNTAIYIAGFAKTASGYKILPVCHILVILFTAFTLIVLNGLHRKTFAAIFSSLIVVALLLGLFELNVRIWGDMDYSSMEYLGTIENPDEFFRAGILIAGLGAIMDVSVTITSSIEEMMRKNADISKRAVLLSSREVGYDIMGTMINVLLFTYLCGLIPEFVLLMNNNIPYFAIIKLHIPYEITRFLLESIGIVLAVPVSMLLGLLFMMRKGQVKS